MLTTQTTNVPITVSNEITSEESNLQGIRYDSLR